MVSRPPLNLGFKPYGCRLAPVVRLGVSYKNTEGHTRHVSRNRQREFSWVWWPTTCDVHILVSSTGPATSISGTLHHAAVPLLAAMRLLFASLVFAFIITAQGAPVISTAAAERRRESYSFFDRVKTLTSNRPVSRGWCNRSAGSHSATVHSP